MIWKFCLMIVTHFPNSTLKSANGIFLYRILLRMSFTFWQILLVLITNARFDSKQLMLLKCLYHHNLSQPVLPMLSSKVFKHYAFHPHGLVVFNTFSLPVCLKVLMVNRCSQENSYSPSGVERKCVRQFPSLAPGIPNLHPQAHSNALCCKKRHSV